MPFSGFGGDGDESPADDEEAAERTVVLGNQSAVEPIYWQTDARQEKGSARRAAGFE